MNQRKSSHKRKRSTKRRPHHYHWAWPVGGLLMLALYAWAFYYFFVGPTGFRWRAMYGDANYPLGYEIHGIDISHYQGDIDWHKLERAKITGCPLRFVFIKSTEGASKIDDRFAINFRQARQHGFIRGVYHFWSNTSGPREQAYHFLDNVKLEKGDLPPVLDIEHKPADRTTEEFQQDVLLWLHIVEDRYHVKPILYTYYKFKEQYLNTTAFEQYPYWIAHYYVPEVTYQGQWRFWQHTDAGRLPGIKGEVDLDIYNGSYYDLLQLCIGANQE